MGNSQPQDPGMMGPGKQTKQALNALALMFGQEKGSFKSIFDAQPFFDQLSQMQQESAFNTQTGISEKTQEYLKNDGGLLGSIYKEGLAGPGLSQAEQSFFQQQIGSEQAARGVYGSPVSGAQAGALLGMYGIQRQMQRQDRALQILSGLTPAAAPQYNVPGNFGTMQQGALQGYQAYGQYYGAQMQAQGSAYQGLGQAAGTAAGLAMMCWVAEELYGADDERTHAARRYATSHDTTFTRAYAKHGKAWAAWLRENEWAKPVVRPLWDWMAEQGRLMVEVA